MATVPSPDIPKEALIEAAKAVATAAYSPYSGVRVGAAVLSEAGAVHSGCNVENASYSLTCCAERNAVFSAVAAEGGVAFRLAAIAVWSADLPLPTPCGACRQVLHEFGPEAAVVLVGPSARVDTTVTDLLPLPFDLDA